MQHTPSLDVTKFNVPKMQYWPDAMYDKIKTLIFSLSDALNLVLGGPHSLNLVILPMLQCQLWKSLIDDCSIDWRPACCSPCSPRTKSQIVPTLLLNLLFFNIYFIVHGAWSLWHSYIRWWHQILLLHLPRLCITLYFYR